MTYNYFLQVPAYPKEPATKKVFVAWLEQCFKVGCLDKTQELTSLIKSNCAKAVLVAKCLELHKQMLNVVKDQSTTEHVASNKRDWKLSLRLVFGHTRPSHCDSINSAIRAKRSAAEQKLAKQEANTFLETLEVVEYESQPKPPIPDLHSKILQSKPTKLFDKLLGEFQKNGSWRVDLEGKRIGEGNCYYYHHELLECIGYHTLQE